MIKITLTVEQEDQVVIESLKTLHLNLITDKDEGGILLEADPELVKSIEHVLSYFMAPGAYRTWKTVVDNRTTV